MRFERWLYSAPLKWRSLFQRRDADRDLDDEIRYHLETEVEGLVSRGMGRDEAWRVVRRGFGGIDQATEQCRDARGLNTIDALAQDTRFAARMLRRHPGFTIVAVLTLALGIGANTAVFSLVDGILLSRLPYPDSKRLVSVTGTYPNGAFAALRDESRTMDVAAYAEGKWLRLKAGGAPIRVSATRVSAELFAILGAKPALGRTLRPGEDEALRDRYAILSHELWATRFARDEQIVGRFIDLDGVRREVVAVMPATFRFPSSRTQLWVPLGLDPADTTAHWAGDFMPVVGRLRAGASLAEGHAEVRAFQARIGTLFPWRMPADWNQDVAVIPLQEAAAAGVRRRLLILFAAVSLVLLIACANVANLSLSRAAARQREIAIRTALGASPRRIARQLLTESVMLASLGGGAGLLVAAQLLTILKFALPPDTPRLLEAHLSWRVLLFTAGVSILTGCAFGLAPMLNALRLRLRAVLDSGGRGSGPAVGGPLRATLTVAQIACAVPLVIAAALLLRNLWMLSHLNPGFNPDPIVTARISASGSRCETTERCLAFFRDVDDQSRTAPGVSGAALVNTLPLTGAVAKRSLEIEGFAVAAGRTAPLFWLHVITPAYFDVMNMQLASGRAFAREDQIGPPVAIVTAATARRFWDRENPIGWRVRFVGTNQWHTVVGVIADVRAYDMTRDVPNWIDGTIYVPYGPYATMEDGRVPTDMTLTLRTTLAGARVEAMLQQLAAGWGGDTVIGDVRPMRSILADAVAAPTATTSLLVTMAGLALVLGCIGVYGVLSFLVSRQTRDLGIRVARGAERRDVFWLVIKEGASLCGGGIVLGIAGSFTLTRWLSSELHGVSPLDPATYVAVAVVMATVTLTACYVPTRRAMSIDPLTALRDQ